MSWGGKPKPLAAGGRDPVRLQDRRDPHRNRRPWIAHGRGLARAPDQDASLRPAADHDRGGVQGRRHRQGRRRLAARHEAARADGQGHRAGPGRSVLCRIFRSRGREGPPAGQRGLLLARRHQGQRLRASDRGRGRAGRPDRGQGGASRRRARHRSDPASDQRNYDRGRSIPRMRQDVKPLDIVQKDGPSFSVEGWKVRWQNWSFRVGWTAREGLVLHQIGFRDGRTRAADHLPRQRHRHGRALRGSDRQPFLEERVRRRRIRARQARQRAGARLRLPRPHPLFRRAGRRRLRQADRS